MDLPFVPYRIKVVERVKRVRRDEREAYLTKPASISSACPRRRSTSTC